jgi:hypothetical protein
MIGTMTMAKTYESRKSNNVGGARGWRIEMGEPFYRQSLPFIQ